MTDRLEVLLVHRVRHQDWSLPKGKLDPGEHLLAAAVREVEEETGVPVRVGPFLARHEYRLTRPPGGIKQVTYWSARPVDGTASRADDYTPNDEVDHVWWAPLDVARTTLTYSRDVAVLDRLERLLTAGAHTSTPLLVLRHAAAAAREEWQRADPDRPLSAEGSEQARRLRPLLAAYGIDTVLSSDARRCVETVQPYADAQGLHVHVDPAWSEEAVDSAQQRAAVSGLRHDERRMVLCTHRPVLPAVLAEWGLAETKLEPGEALVVHRGAGTVVGTELLSP